MEQSYHDKFLLYLESTHSFNEDGRKQLIDFAENQMPEFLHANGHPEFGELYDNLDPGFWAGITTDSLPNSTEDERAYAKQVMQSRKFIRGFIEFNKTANYKKLFADKLRREQEKAARDCHNTSAPRDDFSRPEDDGQPRQEGAVSQVCVTHYERNPEDRRKALERDNYECQVCHMKFIDTYGEIGKEYIEVHHLYPVCNMGENYQFDPLDPERGLVCLCSNCHSMIHRGGHFEEIDGERKMVPMSLKELQKLYNEHNKKD